MVVDPIRTLLAAIEEEARALPGVALAAAGGAVDGRSGRVKAAIGREPPPGLTAFWQRFDGGVLGADLKLLRFDESLERARKLARGKELRGLWPIAEQGRRTFALDAEAAASDGEWPVVELGERTVDRVATSFLRFLRVLLAGLAFPEGGDEIDLLRELTRRDPGFSGHWVDLIEELQRAGREADADAALEQAMAVATPPGPALVVAFGLRAQEKGDRARARAAFADAMALEAQTPLDDDARLDGAALLLGLAREDGDALTEARAREALGAALPSTGAYFRAETMRALAEGQAARAEVAYRVALALLPEDLDLPRLGAAPASGTLAALRSLRAAREALDQGRLDDAESAARLAVREGAGLGATHAVLAEILNARHDRGAVAEARRATELNPALAEGWRELGDALLEQGDAVGAEKAYREMLARDAANGLALAKLAQALLELGRTAEALETIEQAAERGGDAFFVSAVRGDILAELRRHREAAAAYDAALNLEPDDHWVLHQAALEHGYAGNSSRAAELFERAIESDHEGCLQTFVDYGDLLRRSGRIGDAVRLYRKAVQGAPTEPSFRQALRDAEKELQQAPN